MNPLLPGGLSSRPAKLTVPAARHPDLDSWDRETPLPEEPMPEPQRDVNLADETCHFTLHVIALAGCLAKSSGNNRHLENVLAAELADFRPGAPARWTADRCVFADGRIVAVIRRGPNGAAIVNRFDP